MSDKTVCVSLSDLSRAHGWIVYRVRTASSTYHVALAPPGPQRFALLRGYSVGAGRLIDCRDSDPHIGDDSLFDIAPAQWTGRALAFGTTETSPVVEAVVEADATIVTALVTAERPAYPENWIENIETVALFLGRLYRTAGVLDDIRARPAPLARLNVALAECALLLRAIAGTL